MDKTLTRILIVGLGSIGHRHISIIKMHLPQIQIGVLRHSTCKETTHHPHIDVCFTYIEQAIQFSPQIAIIANPATYHMDIALPLAQVGVHLLIEKPISATPTQVNELITTCENNAVTLMTAYNLRFLPSLQYLHTQLNKERIGKIFSVRAEVGQYLPSWRPNSDYRNTVSAQSNLGGGVLLELSHEIDYLCWLFGDVTWVNAVLSKQSDLDIDVEDTAHLILKFSDNSLIASLNMDFIRQDTTRTCTIIGQNGTLQWDAILGTVKLFQTNNWQTLFSSPPQKDESYQSEWKHFIDCVTHRTPPMISGQDGLKVLNIIQAARLSSETQSVIEIN